MESPTFLPTHTDCMLYAQALTYIASGPTEVGGLLQEVSNLNPGPLVQKSTYAMNGASAWESHGKPSGFSDLSCPVIHPLLIAFSGGASDWVDENIQSELSMAALAEYGVNMDHPCVRVFNKEEVGANREFLEATAHCLALLDFLEVRFTPLPPSLT